MVNSIKGRDDEEPALAGGYPVVLCRRILVDSSIGVMLVLPSNASRYITGSVVTGDGAFLLN